MIYKIVAINDPSILATSVLSGMDHVRTCVNCDDRLAPPLEVKSQYTITGTQVEDVFMRLGIQELHDRRTKNRHERGVLDVLSRGPLVLITILDLCLCGSG